MRRRRLRPWPGKSGVLRVPGIRSVCDKKRSASRRPFSILAGRYGILPGRGRILQSLNLKNPRAYSLASELSHLTGESLTATVITALEQRLESERRKRGSRTADRILAFAERFAPGMAPGSHSENHAAELYDDEGMPQ